MKTAETNSGNSLFKKSVVISCALIALTAGASPQPSNVREEQPWVAPAPHANETEARTLPEATSTGALAVLALVSLAVASVALNRKRKIKNQGEGRPLETD